MRDCEVSHVRALLQFMYVGQVNIAQAQLSAFLRTADALQIRGLTDCSQHNEKVNINNHLVKKIILDPQCSYYFSVFFFLRR